MEVCNKFALSLSLSFVFLVLFPINLFIVSHSHFILSLSPWSFGLCYTTCFSIPFQGRFGNTAAPHLPLFIFFSSFLNTRLQNNTTRNKGQPRERGHPLRPRAASISSSPSPGMAACLGLVSKRTALGGVLARRKPTWDHFRSPAMYDAA